MSYPSGTLITGDLIVNNEFTIGNYNFPTTVGTDGQFLGVINGELGFTTAQPGAGVANVVVDGSLGDLMVSNLNGNNEIELTIATNPTLSLDQLVISTPDGTPAYSLPVFADGVAPPEGYVIAMGKGGICEFVPAGSGGGSVNSVTGSDNITIGGTLTDPVVELPPNLIDMTSIQFTNSAIPTPATTINLDGTTGNILCGGIEINDGSGFSIITSQTTLQIVNTNSAETVTLAILNGEGGASILMDGELGSIQTNLLEINSGIPQSSDGFMGSTSITNDVYIVSTATGGNVPSYSLPQLSTADDVLPNLFPVTGLAVSNNNQLAFQSLDTLFNTGQDVSFVADETNKINTLLNATGTRANGSFLQASGPDGGDLAWVASLPSGGSITAGDNISVVDAGSGDYTISTVQNPTFTGNVDCTLNLTVGGTLSCLDMTIGDVGFDVPAPTDGGKVLTYDNINDKMYWGEAGGSGVQSVTAGDTNIVVGGTLIDPTVSLNTDISADSISTLETTGVSFPNGMNTAFFTLNGFPLVLPEPADDGKILSFDNTAQSMTWISNAAGGVQSVSGTSGQIEVNNPDGNAVVSFPTTGNVEFPNSISIDGVALLVPQPADDQKILLYNNTQMQMQWVTNEASGIQTILGTAGQIDASNDNDVVTISFPSVGPANFPNSISIGNTGFTAPQSTDDGKILSYNNTSQQMEWVENVADGIQSVLGTTGQIDANNDNNVVTISFPETGNVVFPNSINIGGIDFNIPQLTDAGKILSYDNGLNQMNWIPAPTDSGVLSVIAGTGINVSGTGDEPIINLDNNIVLGNTGSISAPIFQIQSTPNNTNGVNLPFLTDGSYPPAGYIISSDGLGGTVFTANSADGVLSVGGDANITIGGSLQYPDVQLNQTVGITQLNTAGINISDVFNFPPLSVAPVVNTIICANGSTPTSGSSFKALSELFTDNDIVITSNIDNTVKLNLIDTNKTTNAVLASTSNVAEGIAWTQNISVNQVTAPVILGNDIKVTSTPTGTQFYTLPYIADTDVLPNNGLIVIQPNGSADLQQLDTIISGNGQIVPDGYDNNYLNLSINTTNAKATDYILQSTDTVNGLEWVPYTEILSQTTYHLFEIVSTDLLIFNLGVKCTLFRSGLKNIEISQVQGSTSNNYAIVTYGDNTSVFPDNIEILLSDLVYVSGDDVPASTYGSTSDGTITIFSVPNNLSTTKYLGEYPLTKKLGTNPLGYEANMILSIYPTSMFMNFINLAKTQTYTLQHGSGYNFGYAFISLDNICIGGNYY